MDKTRPLIIIIIIIIYEYVVFFVTNNLCYGSLILKKNDVV